MTEDGGDRAERERRRERKPRGRLPVCASSCSCRQAGGVTTAQFVHSACGKGAGRPSNERSLLGRTPTDGSGARRDARGHEGVKENVRRRKRETAGICIPYA